MQVTVVWERLLHQRGEMRDVVVAGDRVVVHERGTRLVGLDRAGGTPVWDVPAGTWPRGVALAGDRCLVVPQTPGLLLCVDVTAGVERWRVELGPAWGHVVATADTAVVGGWRGYTPLSAHDLRDGRALWRHPPPPRPGPGSAPQPAAPVHWGGGVLTGAGAAVWLVEPRAGGTLATWRLPAPMVGPDPFLVLDPDRCLVLGGRGAVVLLDRRRGAEEILRLDGGVPASAELVGGLVWLHGVRGHGVRGHGVRVHGPRHGHTVIDIDARVPVFRVDPGVRLAPGAARVAGGYVVATEGGVLLGVGPDGRVAGRTPHTRRVRALRDLGDGTLLITTGGTLQRVAVRL